MPVVHFNHSGAGLPAPETLQVIVEHLQSEADYGPMEAGARAAGPLDKTYETAAKLLGCTAKDIVFGSGHGQLYGDIVSAIPLASGQKILVSRQEWIGNILCLQRNASLSGATLSLMASDDTSAVDVAALRASLDPDVRIVALTWIGASGALINPAVAIGKAIRESGSSAFFIIDASQAIGQIPIDVTDIGCDALVACGRKYLRGPRGTAVAYVSQRLAAEIVVRRIDNFSSTWTKGEPVVHKSGRALEVAEGSVALRLGLGHAMEQAIQQGLDTTRATLNAKASGLRHALAATPGVHLLDLGADQAACVTFIIDGLSCIGVRQKLAEQGITIGVNGPQYTPYDLEMRGVSELLRASVHVSTTERDIEMLVAAVDRLASGHASAKQGITL